MRTAVWMMSAALVLSACATEDDELSADAGNDDVSSTKGAVTYQRDIRPLIETRCLGCHVLGGAGPFPLDSWTQVKELAPQIVGAVQSKLMPPWPVDESCHPLRDVSTLDDAERELFGKWADNDFAKGDAKDYVAPKQLDDMPMLGKPDIEMQPDAGYVPGRVNLTDEYRCFLLPGGFDQDTYVTAMDIAPGTPEAVHHVQIHTIPASSVAAAQAADDKDVELGYQCFGGPAVSGSFNMFSWRPGSQPVRFERGDAALIEKGTRIVIQVHYNVHNPDKKLPADRSTIKFWTTPKGEIPERIVRRASVISTKLSVPAGEAHYVTEQTWSMRNVSSIGGMFGIGGKYVQGEIIGQTPHMHQFGTRLSVKLTHEDGSEECLVDVPRWNFEWQMDYLYSPKDSMPYSPDDTLTVRCEYDNSAEHQPLVNGTPRDPINVSWGEGSLDEMCLNYVWVRYERAAYLAALPK